MVYIYILKLLATNYVQSLNVETLNIMACNIIIKFTTYIAVRAIEH